MAAAESPHGLMGSGGDGRCRAHSPWGCPRATTDACGACPCVGGAQRHRAGPRVLPGGGGDLGARGEEKGGKEGEEERDWKGKGQPEKKAQPGDREDGGAGGAQGWGRECQVSACPQVSVSTGTLAQACYDPGEFNMLLKMEKLPSSAKRHSIPSTPGSEYPLALAFLLPSPPLFQDCGLPWRQRDGGCSVSGVCPPGGGEASNAHPTGGRSPQCGAAGPPAREVTDLRGLLLPTSGAAPPFAAVGTVLGRRAGQEGWRQQRGPWGSVSTRGPPRVMHFQAGHVKCVSVQP